VCTDMPVYRRVVNHMHNGMLISNNDWYEALLLLIEDKQLRTKLSLQGHKWAKKNRDISTGYKHWENLCKKVVSKGVDLYKR
jgi:glycosyltransferase involved in cell wall biosynthesis